VIAIICIHLPVLSSPLPSRPSAHPRVVLSASNGFLRNTRPAVTPADMRLSCCQVTHG
jgi:hypothetical protein